MMINSSPEYAITKPGVAHYLSRKRDKPLRTYGRRPASTPEPRGEPPAKKARLETDTQIDTEKKLQLKPGPPLKKEEVESTPYLEKELPLLPSTETATRSSILQYFKPLPTEPKPECVGIKEDLCNDADVALSQVVRTRRMPRLLRIRATSLPSDESEDGVSLSSRDETDSNNPSPDGRRENLHGAGDKPSDQRRRDSTSSGIKLRGKRRLMRSPAVQTTLNISSKAAFAECKVCDTVWNPLFPDDVKYHEKRHKNVTKKAKKVDDL